jgi:hypothetical protein
MFAKGLFFVSKFLNWHTHQHFHISLYFFLAGFVEEEVRFCVQHRKRPQKQHDFDSSFALFRSDSCAQIIDGTFNTMTGRIYEYFLSIKLKRNYSLQLYFWKSKPPARSLTRPHKRVSFEKLLLSFYHPRENETKQDIVFINILHFNKL